MSKLPHCIHKSLKCDWRSRACSYVFGRVNLFASEFSPEGIYRTLSVKSASTSNKKSLKTKLYRSSFGGIPFYTACNIVLLSMFIAIVLTRRTSGQESTGRHKSSYRANVFLTLTWDHAHSAEKSTSDDASVTCGGCIQCS